MAVPALGHRGPPRGDFSALDWSYNVARGFCGEISSSWRDLFSMRGIATATVLTAVMRKFERLGKVGAVCGGGLGILNLVVGVINTFRSPGTLGEIGGLEVGRGVFYSLPIAKFLFGRVQTRRMVSLFKEGLARSQEQGGRVARTVEELEGTQARLDSELEKVTEELSPWYASWVRNAYRDPVFGAPVPPDTHATAALNGRIYLPLTQDDLGSNPLIRAAMEVQLASHKLHEAVHLRQYALMYPKLVRYCHEFYGPNELPPRTWQLASRLFSRSPLFRPPWCETLKLLVYRPQRRMEREAYRFQKEALDRAMGDIDWYQTVNKLTQEVIPTGNASRSDFAALGRLFEEVPTFSIMRSLDASSYVSFMIYDSAPSRNLQLGFPIESVPTWIYGYSLFRTVREKVFTEGRSSS